MSSSARNPAGICGVVFDLDGLLVDSEVYWERARRAFSAAHGCDWTEADEHAAKGRNSKEWADLIADRCHLNLPLPAIIDGVVDRMRQLYSAHVPVLPGAVGAVRSLSREWPLALASSSPPDLIDSVLRAMEIRDSFRHVVSADSVGRGKPAPDVFLRAIEAIGCAPQRVVIFEDSTAGILAGTAAGSRVVAVPNVRYPPSREALSAATRVLPSLEGVDALTLEALPEAG